MKLIDLTQTIAPDMPVYPGTAPPVFRIGCTLEADGFLEKEIRLFSHTGTHVDAPAHLLSGGKTLDQMPIQSFYGQALLVHYAGGPGSSIEVADLELFRKDLAEVDFLLIRTGWSRYWGTKAYFSDFPVLCEKAASWLSGFNLKGIGVDAISVDPAQSANFPVHKVLLGEGILLVENLANLDKIGCHRFEFSCLPLKIADADGAPVRAAAIIADEANS